MSKVVSLRLKDDQVRRLAKAARRLGRTPSETAAVLLEEALRQAEFAFIEFRDSAVGRQAYIKGSRLAVWQIAALARSFGDDPERIAAHLEVPETWIRAAFTYASAYPDEIGGAIADNEHDITALRRLIPSLEVVDAPAP